ncbi:hypothetical protein SAMN05216267_103314 [Actinacidiphila rubida]|uniref:Uncharacterized protein n=1 Tax=Actinacidiphila rubida TaxID=310780 RepID=A0A1H8R6L6_9ACTN|nr:hypothetical protein [Actinacidiphila rubida]SEO61967.1 hypothetical protein SAMN05216267_103314 [Actinacidiphila rubida]
MHDGDDDQPRRNPDSTDLAPPLHLAGIDDDELAEPHLVRGID